MFGCNDVLMTADGGGATHTSNGSSAPGESENACSTLAVESTDGPATTVLLKEFCNSHPHYKGELEDFHFSDSKSTY